MAAISFGEVPNNFWSEDFWMGKPHTVNQYDVELDFLHANPGKWNISVPGGRENNVRKNNISLVAASEKGGAQT